MTACAWGEEIRKECLTHPLVLEHLEELLDAFVPSLQRLFLRLYSQFQLLQQKEEAQRRSE